MKMYYLKQRLQRRESARNYYKNHSLEDDLIAVFEHLGSVDIETDNRKLSYKVITVRNKMEKGASNAIMQMVIRDVRDFYLPIQEALIQIEHDKPGKSTLIAQEVSLFYTHLKSMGYSKDEIYYAISDWLDVKTNRQCPNLTPIITAFYIQDCEVFSL